MNLSKMRLSLLVFLCLFVMSGFVAQVTMAVEDFPEGVKYLQEGYNSLTQEPIYRFQALDFPNGAVATTDGVKSKYDFIYSNSRYELEKEISKKFEEGVNAGYGIVSADASLSKEVVTNTKFSAETTTVIAYWRQIDKKVYSKGLPVLNEAALALLQNDPKKFVLRYGDRYVCGVTLGRMYYVIYQANTTNLSESRITEIKKAMSLQAGSYVGGEYSSEDAEYVKKTLNGVSKTCSVVGTGIPFLMGINSEADIDNIRYLVGLSEPAVLAKEYDSYSETSNSAGYIFFDTVEYLKMADQWRKHYSNFEYICSNERVSTLLKDDCDAAMNTVNSQLSLVCSLDNSARYPNVETATFNSLYSRYLTEMNIRPQWCTASEMIGKGSAKGESTQEVKIDVSRLRLQIIEAR